MAEDEQTEQGGGFQGAVPLLASVAAGAAAGAIAVVARKALSGDGDDEGGGGDEPSARDEDGGTAFDDIEQVADDLAGLVDQLRAQAEGEPDFQRLIQLADAISEYADQAANAFEAAEGSGDDEEGSERRVTDDLMSRIGELTEGKGELAGAGAGAGREKETS